MTSRLAGVSVVAFVVALAQNAHANAQIVRGTIVKIEQQEVYVTVGATQGAEAGAALRIKRTIKLRHPITRVAVEDWIPIGAATITQAGASLSRAVIGDLVTDVKVGDDVEIFVEDDDPPSPPTPVPQPQLPPAPPADPVTLEVLTVFSQQTGRSLDARIAGWENYLSTHADSPHADAIARDIAVMRDLREELQPPTITGPTVVANARHEVRSSAPPGEPVPLVFVLDSPGTVASAYLHFRTRGARTYRRMLLAREHDIYLRGALPAEVVAPPGVEYFVEVSTPSGRTGLAAGTPDGPLSIDVTTPTVLDQFAARPGQSSLRFSGEYLDFATLDKRAGNHRDRVAVLNADFLYSLGGTIDAVGVGYGSYYGQGGSQDMNWGARRVPSARFTYGYASVEMATREEGVALGFEAALYAGVGEEGFGLGLSALFRIGDRERTNVSFAARTIEQVGTLTDIRLGTRPAQDVIIGVSVGATTQPLGDDLGAKLGVDLEWKHFSPLSFIVRGSWQGRSAAHSGVGGGGGLGFSW